MNENKKISGKTIIIIIGIIATIFLVIIPLYREYNLKKYCIYYAQHIPHAQGTDPVLVMVGANLHWINEPCPPEGQLYTYDEDGHTTLTIKERNEQGEWVQIGFFGGDTSDVYYTLWDSPSSNVSYAFDERGELELIEYDRKGAKNVFTEKEKEKAYKQTYSVVQRYIDCQSIPIINLQGIFNRRYQSQFD